MKIGLTQFDMLWEDKDENRKKASRLVEEASAQGVELLVFPEMTLTGFTTNTAYAGEPMENSPTLDYFCEAALTCGISIAFGYVEAREGHFYNKLAIASRGEIIYDYAKIHPFSYGTEGLHYTGGTQVSTTILQDVRLSGFVCYDLRFPEVFQAVSDETDAILVIANWPRSRIGHWQVLLQARAIENQCYVIGVNRTGVGDGLTYVPSSMAFDPLGKRLTEEGCHDALQIVEVLPQVVSQVRRKFPFRQDRRPQLYRSL